MQLPPLTLYIHLPWCERKCPYCDFNSHAAEAFAENAYVDALLRDLRGDLPLVRERRVESLFIGGGTPSLFSAAAIARLLREIGELLPLSPDLETTLEANPGSAEAGKFLAFRQAGINRLSLGVQSFDERCLQALGRVHDSEQAHAAVACARDAGFASVNIDLMHGLPRQSTRGALHDLRCAIDHAPAHLSWYQLTIEPNTAFHKRPPLLPVEDVLDEIQTAGAQLLERSGYRQYEVSAYCRGGFACRHNLNYWRFGDYLGIGAGAHGKISFGDGSIRRYAKKRQPEHYLAAQPGQFCAASRTLHRQDLIAEFMLNALRLNEGFSPTQFSARTGLPGASLEPQLTTLCARELLQRDAKCIRATDLGRRFLNEIIAEFFPD
ncbi:MAG: radical SAM family heme chaperone HemW [Halioglobus sp.]|nr:radical SAM family heme chaperone HemW [Halioglobus sp.]